MSGIFKKFKPGKEGLHFDASDLSSLFQDAEGTVPVTAVGQPLGCIKDKSGSNNHLICNPGTVLGIDSAGNTYADWSKSFTAKKAPK